MNTKKPMSSLQKCFYAVSFIVLIAAFVFLGTKNYKIKELSDAEQFSREYRTVSSDNLFQVFDSAEALTFLEKGTGILFLGFPDNKWSSSIAEMLDQVSHEYNYPVNYFNFYDERENRHDNYLGILTEVDEYLNLDDKGRLNLYAPTIIGVVKGDVIYFDDETTFMNQKMEPSDYWTPSQKEKKMLRLRSLFLEMKGK